jgi:hypothetical protein
MADSVSTRQCHKADAGPCFRRDARLTQDKNRNKALANLVWPSTGWETTMGCVANAVHHEPWNVGKIVGLKAPFKVKEICALRLRLRLRLQIENRVRELAHFAGVDRALSWHRGRRRSGDL